MIHPSSLSVVAYYLRLLCEVTATEPPYPLASPLECILGGVVGNNVGTAQTFGDQLGFAGSAQVVRATLQLREGEGLQRRDFLISTAAS